MDRLEVMVVEFEEEIENVSPLEPRLLPEAPGLRVAATKKMRKQILGHLDLRMPSKAGK